MSNPNARLEAFCDGVFAIALTLLIIEIKVPSVEHIHTKEELWAAFAHAWPSWAAFLMSFITILISWVNHSHSLKLINKTSKKFAYANGLMLLAIIILPFPTAAVGEYIETDFAQPAITIYCGAALLGNIAWLVVGYAALHPISLYKENIDLEKIKKNTNYVKMGFFVYASTFILSFWFPLTAFCIVGFTFLMWLILGIAVEEQKLIKE